MTAQTEADPELQDNRLPIFFVVLTIVVDAMGFGIIMPVLPDLIREIQGVDLSDAARWGGILLAAFAATQFLLSPTVGNISDRFGRRPVLLIALAALAVDYLIMAQAHTIWLLLLGRIIAGALAATYATATAYVADVTTREKRAEAFGLISAGFGVGFILGPALGGFLAEFGARAPFYASAAIAGLSAIAGYFILPESLAHSKRRPFQWRRANPLGGFLQVKQLPGMGWMLVMLFFFMVAGMIYPTIWVYYTQASFGWSEQLVGISLTVYGVATVVVQVWLIRLILPRLGEFQTLLWALVLDMVIFICFGLASHAWMIWVITPIAAVASIATPAMNSIMSRAAGEDQQGELQGVVGSISAVASVISPLLMAETFRYFTNENAPIFLPGAPFFLALALIIVAITIYVLILPRLRAGQEGGG